MRFSRLRMSYRSQNLLAMIKGRTGITPNISGRFAICLSLRDPSPPQPRGVRREGSEIHPSVLFGEYEEVFMALMVMRPAKGRPRRADLPEPHAAGPTSTGAPSCCTPGSGTLDDF